MYYLGRWNGDPRAAGVGITLAGLGVAFTIFAWFQGWKLVQDHHVGVSPVTEKEVVEHEGILMRRTG